MACQWIAGQDGYWHWAFYTSNTTFQDCNELDFEKLVVTIVGIAAIAGLICWLLNDLVFSSDDNQPQPAAAQTSGRSRSIWDMSLTEMLSYLFASKPELPPSPDPFDEVKQTNQARQSRRKYAPHVQSIEWDVILNHETVELYIRISPEEARLIREYGLDDIEYENGPAYSPEELEEIHDRHVEEEANVADPYKRSILRLAHEEALERLKQMKLVVRLGDYLGDYPYTRIFRNRLAATAYSDFLKRNVLPAIKKELEMRKTEAAWQTV